MKNRWFRYSALFLMTLLIISISSCDKEECDVVNSYIIENLEGQSESIELFKFTSDVNQIVMKNHNINEKS
ncbi:hypothetical protein [Helcococcus sueciensis]|uniref:hypothetical protein n=1 Tax=Helcococcus sueciensis TaxID=241555 RepID=UPI0003FE9D49|nr:hypothetical protein [Helcococcus sueciensis]